MPTSYTPPAVSASSSDIDSSVSSSIHLVVSSSLSFVHVPPTQYFPPTPFFCVFTDGFSVVLPPPLAAIVDVYVASVAPLDAPALPRFSPPLSRITPPSPLPQPLPSLGLLHPPAPTRAPPHQSHAVNIYCRDKEVGDWTSGGEAY